MRFKNIVISILEHKVATAGKGKPGAPCVYLLKHFTVRSAFLAAALQLISQLSLNGRLQESAMLNGYVCCEELFDSFLKVR